MIFGIMVYVFDNRSSLFSESAILCVHDRNLCDLRISTLFRFYTFELLSELYILMCFTL